MTSKTGGSALAVGAHPAHLFKRMVELLGSSKHAGWDCYATLPDGSHEYVGIAQIISGVKVHELLGGIDTYEPVVPYNIVSLNVPWEFRKSVLDKSEHTTSFNIDILVDSQIKKLAELLKIELKPGLSPFRTQIGYVFPSPSVISLPGEKVVYNGTGITLHVQFSNHGNLEAPSASSSLILPNGSESFGLEASLISKAVRESEQPRGVSKPQELLDLFDRYVQTYIVPGLTKARLQRESLP